MARRRPTRTTLRGWTRGLTPLAACFGLMFLFVWFEGQLVRNNTRANDLKIEIEVVKASIAKLEEQENRLNSMEQMEQNLNDMENMERNAPDLLLREAEPGQIVTIKGAHRRAMRTPAHLEFDERRRALPTRSVLLRLGPPDVVSVDTRLDHEVARLDSVQGPPG